MSCSETEFVVKLVLLIRLASISKASQSISDDKTNSPDAKGFEQPDKLTLVMNENERA